MGELKLEGFDKRMALEVIEDTLEALHGPEDRGWWRGCAGRFICAGC